MQEGVAKQVALTESRHGPFEPHLRGLSVAGVCAGGPGSTHARALGHRIRGVCVCVCVVDVQQGHACRAARVQAVQTAMERHRRVMDELSGLRTGPAGKGRSSPSMQQPLHGVRVWDEPARAGSGSTSPGCPRAATWTAYNTVLYCFVLYCTVP